MANSLNLKLGQVFKNTYKVAAQFHCSASVCVKLPADDAEINYIDLGNTCKTMSFASLKELTANAQNTKKRQLLQVQTIGKQQARPTFRLANKRELEVLVHKSRVDKIYSYFLVDLNNLDQPLIKLKEKIFTISLDSPEEVVASTVKKVRKSLEKENFVVLKFDRRAHSSSELEKFETAVKKRCLDGLEDKETRLVT